MKLSSKSLVVTAFVAAALGTVGTAVAAASPSGHHHTGRPPHRVTSAVVQIVTPRPGDVAGTAGQNWVVDLKLEYRNAGAAGFTTPQLTGPAAHNNVAPFPGNFATGADERLPGLVVLDSSTSATLAGFSGPGTNLANLFNVTALIDQDRHHATIADTWIVGAPFAGKDVDTTLTVAVVADLNHDGVLNDAPAVVPDANHDGRVDARDLAKLGVASRVETVRFHLAGPAA